MRHLSITAVLILTVLRSTASLADQEGSVADQLQVSVAALLASGMSYAKISDSTGRSVKELKALMAPAIDDAMAKATIKSLLKKGHSYEKIGELLGRPVSELKTINKIEITPENLVSVAAPLRIEEKLSTGEIAGLLGVTKDDLKEAFAEARHARKERKKESKVTRNQGAQERLRTQMQIVQTHIDQLGYVSQVPRAVRKTLKATLEAATLKKDLLSAKLNRIQSAENYRLAEGYNLPRENRSAGWEKADGTYQSGSQQAKTAAQTRKTAWQQYRHGNQALRRQGLKRPEY